MTTLLNRQVILPDYINTIKSKEQTSAPERT